MHDSMAFHGTKLIAWLKDNVDWLQKKNFFLLGNSAYNISPYLLTPYGQDADIVGSPKDTFNFWHSNSHICVECAFGELRMQWEFFGEYFRWILLHVDQL
jgi:hypothetical protein